MARLISRARSRLGHGGPGSERGASLVLALAFLTLFGALIVALLGFAQTAFLANVGVHKQGVTQYAMAGAIDVNIQRARKDPTAGLPSCTPVAYAGMSVGCTPRSNDGSLRPGVNAPLNAILTLQGGITNNTPGSTMTVAGPVYAHGPISLTADSVLDAEDLPVTGSACGSDTTNWRFAEPIVSCPPVSGVAPPAGAGNDPGYASTLPAKALGRAINDVPNNETGGVECRGGSGGRYLYYPPGYYNDASALTTSAGCGNAVARYFPPGTYYFDFGTGCKGGNGPKCDTEWVVSGLPVIGGTATGWLGVGPPPAAPTVASAEPTACSRGPGAEFVFGGASTVSVASGARVELCQGDGQIVIYGQRDTVAPPPPLGPTGVSSPIVCPVTVTATTGPCWRNADGEAAFTAGRVLTVNGQTAQAVVTEPPGQSDPPSKTSLDFSFPALSDPTNWGDYGVTIAVPHVESLTAGDAKPDVQLLVGTCDALDITALQSVTVPPPSAPNDPLKCVRDAVASPFTVKYQVSLARQSKRDAILLSDLDGIRFTVTPVSDLPRRQETGGSSFLTVASGAKFAAWGIVYMPNADFNVDASGDVIFDRGVILKSLTANGGKAGSAVFRLGGGRRTLLFDAVSDNRKVSALVTVTDYTTPGYWTRIKRWSVKR